MGAAAQLAAGADVEHAHGVAVFLAKKHHGAGFAGAVDVHHARLRGGVGQDFGVHAAFDFGDFFGRDGRAVREVKVGFGGIDERALDDDAD